MATATANAATMGDKSSTFDFAIGGPAPVEWIASQLLYAPLSMGMAKGSPTQGHQADQCLAKHQAPPPHLDAGWDGP